MERSIRSAIDFASRGSGSGDDVVMGGGGRSYGLPIGPYACHAELFQPESLATNDLLLRAVSSRWRRPRVGRAVGTVLRARAVSHYAPYQLIEFDLLLMKRGAMSACIVRAFHHPRRVEAINANDCTDHDEGGTSRPVFDRFGKDPLCDA
jgi:hypothetical protein